MCPLQKTLDNRTIRVPITDVVTPGYVKVVPGEGMPISKTPGRRGDLKIKFNVVYPASLTKAQKDQLRAIL